jgi:hypothetical protein
MEREFGDGGAPAAWSLGVLFVRLCYSAVMSPPERKLIRELAAKYIWWKTPDEALRQPKRVAAQVMDIGDFEDVQRLANEMGEAYLRSVIAEAEPGQLSARSWNYWHHRLGLVKRGKVPPMPRRRFG